MKMMIRYYSLLALLLVGSASLMAQDDPFGSFNPRLYQGYMSINAQVQQNGAIITDAVIAVYCGEELRGKGRVGNGTNPQLAYLSVYGNNTGSYQYLYFKVFTNGCVFTFNPNPTIIYTYDDNIGTEIAPYVITLPVSLVNNANNSDVLTTYNNETCDVVLTGRSLWKDGDWNTLCLPFGIDDFTGTPLEGATVKTLTSSSFADGMLTLNFSEALTSITAGQPCLVKWPAQEPDCVENPVFTGVTISSATANVSTTYVDFVGTYSPVTYSSANRSVLFLGGKSKLYYPDGTKATTINACRAYFQLKGITAGDPSEPSADVKAFVLNFDGGDDADGIGEIQNSKFKIQNEGAGWYDLGGRKLDGKPSKGGIYIHNGKKEILF